MAQKVRKNTGLDLETSLELTTGVGKGWWMVAAAFLSLSQRECFLCVFGMLCSLCRMNWDEEVDEVMKFYLALGAFPDTLGMIFMTC